MEDDAHTRIHRICEQAFGLVDGEVSKFVDMQQTKTALLFVFQQMKGELPQPYEYWFELVFRNFDRDRDGLIHYNDFEEIVTQYYDHYQAHKLDKVGGLAASKTPSGSNPSSGVEEEDPSRRLSTASVPEGSVYSSVPAAMQHYANSVHRLSIANKTPLDEVQFSADGGVRSEPKPPQLNTREATGISPPVDGPSNNVPIVNIARDMYNPKLAIFDEYEFFDKAGQGAFGKVLVVRHKITKQVRACKAVTVRGQAQADLIQTEIRVLRQLDHPNILKLFDTYYDGTNMYMISELCEGGSLQDRLNFHYQEKSPKLMSEGLVALIMQQILGAIAVCHAQHIIHRDIKPENILFVTRAKESPLKLIDFGLATTVDSARAGARELRIKRKGFLGSLSKSMPSCVGSCVKPYSVRRVMPRAGTLNYFSPEMVRGEYNEKTDVFSAGIVMYQLLTGIHPFYIPGVDDEGSVKFKISKREAEYPFDVWNQISADAKELTKLLLNRDYLQRVSAAIALRHRWFKDPLKPTTHGGHASAGLVTQSLFEGLREFSQTTRLKQILLRMLARELTEIQTQELRKKFLSLDKTGTGKISRDALIAGMKSIGMATNDIEHILPVVGGGGGNQSMPEISYNDFLAALSERKVKFGKSQLREAFKRFDVNGTGYIGVDDFKHILCSSEGVSDDPLVVAEILAEANLDSAFFSHNPGVSFADFSEIITNGFVAKHSYGNSNVTSGGPVQDREATDE